MLQAAAGSVLHTRITGSIRDLLPSNEYEALEQHNMVALQGTKPKPVSIPFNGL